MILFVLPINDYINNNYNRMVNYFAYGITNITTINYKQATRFIIVLKCSDKYV